MTPLGCLGRKTSTQTNKKKTSSNHSQIEHFVFGFLRYINTDETLSYFKRLYYSAELTALFSREIFCRRLKGFIQGPVVQN